MGSEKMCVMGLVFLHLYSVAVSGSQNLYMYMLILEVKTVNLVSCYSVLF